MEKSEIQDIFRKIMPIYRNISQQREIRSQNLVRGRGESCGEAPLAVSAGMAYVQVIVGVWLRVVRLRQGESNVMVCHAAVGQ